jgi:hypothetical protein
MSPGRFEKTSQRAFVVTTNGFAERTAQGAKVDDGVAMDILLSLLPLLRSQTRWNCRRDE